MGTEFENQDNTQDTGQDPVEPKQEQPTSDNATAAERVVSTAKEQASEAAEALRKGEFMRDPYVDENASSDDRLIAMLSYASQIFLPLVMPIIVLVSESSKRRPFQRYHAVQSLALVILMMTVGLGSFVGLAILSAVPIIGAVFSLFWLLLCCLTPLMFILAVVTLGFYGYQSYQGKRFSIPGLTSFLMDQGWIE